jgi:lipopolysaccharide export system protein LptA
MYEHNLTRSNRQLATAKQLAKASTKTSWIAIKLVLSGFLLVSLFTNAAYQEEDSDQNSTISSDFNKPVTLNSKNQNLDGKNKIFTYTENVIIRQGSLKLLADQVVVDATAGKRQEIITAQGQPASYSQRQDDGTMVVASANEIIYSVATRTISLKGEASIDQNAVQVSGDSIVFDMAKEQIVASTDDDNNGSVRTVISPGAFDNEDDNKQDKNDGSPK